MIIDTSVALAVVLDESDCNRFLAILNREETIRMSVAGYLEASINLDRNYGPQRRAALDTLIAEFDIRLEPVTVEQIHIASRAFVLFGKGRHRAALNFGDCFSYALAKAYSEPLLFKGNDFSQTDLETAEDRPH